MVAIESSELFRNLRSDELKVLRLIALERQFPAGKEIFREGDPGDGVYVVKSGVVEISGVLGQNARRVFSEIKPGGMFGEMAVIEHRPRSATATAAQDTTAYFIPRGEMLHLIDRSPGLALTLLQVVSHRLREFNKQFVNEIVQGERLTAVGRFARSIVHDLKNPLNIIGLTAELACRPGATPEFRELAQGRIHGQIERISDLVCVKWSMSLTMSLMRSTCLRMRPCDLARISALMPGILNISAERLMMLKGFFKSCTMPCAKRPMTASDSACTSSRR